MENIFWTAYCNNERIVAISEIEKIINQYGYITDFKFFSDISIAIKIELEEHHIDKLFFDLKQYMSLKEFAEMNSVSKEERYIFLNVTFTKGTGDLRIEIPSVPG